MIQEIFGVNATMRALSDWVASMGLGAPAAIEAGLADVRLARVEIHPGLLFSVYLGLFTWGGLWLRDAARR